MEIKRKGYVKLKCELKQANNTIKQLKETNDFERDEIVRLKNEIKLPWFLAALLFSLLIWSLIL